MRYAPVEQITRHNVSDLEVAWTYHTGDVSDGTGEVASTSAFENTPILVDGMLVLCTPFNRVIALDPATGAEHWSYDPEIDLSGRYANQLICRGISSWRDSSRDPAATCARRIFMGTNDAFLIALDAASGRPCEDFAVGGRFDLNPGAGPQKWKGEYQVTSPPEVVGDVVVVGSAVSDNARTDAPSGVIRGFDARTGVQRWAWDLAPPDYDHTTEPTSSEGFALGTPNVWAPMSSDPERDLVFVPTGNPAPDYFRSRENADHYGSSVVALRASTGEVVWHLQTVHHDLWDFDVPAQPTLFSLRRPEGDRPVLVQATKMGLLFVLDRETGEPIFGLEERPVPQNGAPGQVLSPTQPFPLAPPPLVGQSLSPQDAWGITPFDRAACREALEELRFEGMYTPPTEDWTLMYPGNAGGSNWGGVAVDPERQLLLANTMDLAWKVRLVARDEFEATRAANPGREISPQAGTPYGMWRETVLSPLGIPCNPPPWGRLAAVDLESGEILWQRKIGTTRDISPIPIGIELGVPNLGGPLVTRAGLVFLGATLDDYLRAFDVTTGEELWRGRLPAGGQATPMSYEIVDSDAGRRQFVVIAAGGHARGGSRLGDSLVAFALPAD
jgi:quinoprotein glucose dehydrogenase